MIYSAILITIIVFILIGLFVYLEMKGDDK